MPYLTVLLLASCSANPANPTAGNTTCKIIFWAPPAAGSQQYEVFNYATGQTVVATAMPGYDWNQQRPTWAGANYVAYGVTVQMNKGVNYSYDLGSYDTATMIYTYYGGFTAMYDEHTEWFINQ